MPRLLIIAGVNGCGKSTLYNWLEKSVNLGIKINADDMAKELGDFNNSDVQLKAGKKAIKLIDQCINDKVDFNFESTLSGKNIFRKIEKAKANGFTVDIIYIAIDKETSKLRIESRVLKGGHNIKDTDIERRYNKSINNFINNITLFDDIYFYENDDLKHRLIFCIENQRIKYMNKPYSEWVETKFCFKELLAKFKL